MLKTVPLLCCPAPMLSSSSTSLTTGLATSPASDLPCCVRLGNASSSAKLGRFSPRPKEGHSYETAAGEEVYCTGWHSSYTFCANRGGTLPIREASL